MQVAPEPLLLPWYALENAAPDDEGIRDWIEKGEQEGRTVMPTYCFQCKFVFGSSNR
jgi:hypothetical protein